MRLFGKAEDQPEIADPELVGALTAGHAIRDGRLTEEFERQWQRRIDSLRDDEGGQTTVVSDLLDVDSSAVTIRSYEDGAVVSIAGAGAARWPSRAALIADLGAAASLHERGVDPDHTIVDLSAFYAELRGQLDRCPTCGGGIAPEQAVAVACCGASETVVLMCQSRDSRSYEAGEV